MKNLAGKILGLFKLDTHNPYLTIIRKPEIYLTRLAAPTLVIGLITFIVNFIYINTSLHDIKVPNSIHSLVGFVIALLLVFRTNTAYDRWWEGRKKIQELNGSMCYLYTVIKAMRIDGMGKQDSYVSMRLILKHTKEFLTADRYPDRTHEFHGFILDRIHHILSEFNEHKHRGRISDAEVNSVRNLCYDITNQIISLERIRNTPIPLAYSLHIKVSVFIFLITLPFSMFYDLSMWSTPVVMILYFLIAGIDLISTEIENPFSGEPNDLPVNDLFDSIAGHIN